MRYPIELDVSPSSAHDAAVALVIALVTAAVPRARWDPADPNAIYADPELTPAEAGTFADIIASVRSGLGVAPSVYASVRPQLQSLRDLRQMGRNAFMALTATERDRLMYDAQSATTTILLAILRE